MRTRPTSILLLSAALLADGRWRAAHAADRADANLALQASLDEILRLALDRNPDLAEERARVASARARTSQAGRLPDFQLKYEQWGVPLRRPYAVQDSMFVMLGLSQTFPAPGTLDARARAAEQDTSSAAASAATRRRELRAQVRRAFADYYRADRELLLHREHVDLTSRLVELSRASYRSGRRGQQDVLRVSLELSRLRRDLAHIEQERISSQALLNALMNRDTEAALGPPAELAPEALAEASLADADKPPDQGRSEVVAATAAVRKSEASLDLARKEGRWPSISLGADYMYMPFEHERHGFGAMVMLNLPWVSPARRDAVKAAEESLTADRHALESVRNVVRYEARDARARYQAARSTFKIVDQDLLPQAQRNFEAAQAAYSAGQGDAIGLVDALRSYLDTRLDRVRALVHQATTAADLARAAGEKESSK